MINSIILIGLLSIGYTPAQEKNFKNNVWNACLRDNNNDIPGCLIATQAITRCVKEMVDDGHMTEYPIRMEDIWGMKNKRVKDMYFQCINRVLKEMKYNP